LEAVRQRIDAVRVGEKLCAVCLRHYRLH
jgi:hypothetical protein